ncbi:hypothetical protein VD0002_g1930 [Verticillium dahliae]|uniref:MFS maltose permease n=1 Tax=Verticillium dahliae TaxID=27337 RepID=A0AA44WLN9_VERDA|nr:ADIPOR-like receptor spbc12c2.09c [Verticillium dahliae VDG2]KAH6705996.1 hypothetical protein EV126DRAFT_413439 [Verticillium dahliae]PNH33027.1 hypothetical protein BJF96_g3712 [Verticillium dahliae]PNH50395.1 hypothetical protein VD0003_g6771 [Verticillium dahliae]PNH67969.1 hypothetical protein VD0002_g1930 [Verticillium dahliae]
MLPTTRQRLATRRRLTQRLFELPAREFTSNTALASRVRPQLPFLSIPLTTRRRKVRYFTTENKLWLRHEGRLFLRYNISIWGSLVCVVAIGFMLNQEWLEKDFPTPHEWSFLTRMGVRGAKSAQRVAGNRGTNYDEIIVSCQSALKRLEDPQIDGAGVRELLGDEPLSIDGLGSVGKDISTKDENWRRGYYEVMMLLATTLEQVDGWVKDRTRNIVCPPAMVVGPSNPRPQPMPVGAPGAPKEQDCEVAYESAENAYLRILTTKGFSTKQRLDAALAYASFLDFKKVPEAAARVYDWALSIALETVDPSSPPVVDRRTLTLNDRSAAPSENVLSVLTAMATHKAHGGDVAGALPIFVSLLRARRALPTTPPTATRAKSFDSSPSNFWQKLWALAQPPQYPPPPPDGTTPPWRDNKQLCEEAALHLYIGEILYSSNDTLRTREEGLTWTRDGVDLAEEQLRELGPATAANRATKTTCRECLGTGLHNWSLMVKRLAKEEKAQQQEAERKAAAAAGSTSKLGRFWSSAPNPKEAGTRWAAEEKVVYERIRRTNELLVDVAPPSAGLSDLLRA